MQLRARGDGIPERLFIQGAQIPGISGRKKVQFHGSLHTAVIQLHSILVVGIRSLRDPYTHKPFVGFYTTKRLGSMIVNTEALKFLKCAAS